MFFSKKHFPHGKCLSDGVMYAACAAGEAFRRLFLWQCDGCDQHHAKGCAGIVRRAELFFGNIFCFEQQFQPVAGFAGLLERDLKPGDKIRLAMGVLRFADVRADGGSAAADLIGNDGFVFEL